MALPPFHKPTGYAFHNYLSYPGPEGIRFGTDVCAGNEPDALTVSNSGTLIQTYSAWWGSAPADRRIVGGPNNGISGEAVSSYDPYGGGYGIPKNIGFNLNHWCAVQSTIGLDNIGGFMGPAVRAKHGGGCYYLWNQGYTDGMDADVIYMRLYRKAENGTQTILAAFSVNGTAWGIGAGSDEMWDGFWGVIEVEGTDPVHLRVSVAYPGPRNGNYSAYPTIIPNWASGVTLPPGAVAGQPAVMVVCEYTDSSPLRVVTGKPAMVAGAVDANGGGFDLTCGGILGVESQIVTGPGAVTLAGSRCHPGSIVTVTADPSVTVGAVSYQHETGWACALSGLAPGLNYGTVSDGTDSVPFSVVAAPATRLRYGAKTIQLMVSDGVAHQECPVLVSDGTSHK